MRAEPGSTILVDRKREAEDEVDITVIPGRRRSPRRAPFRPDEPTDEADSGDEPEQQPAES